MEDQNIEMLTTDNNVAATEILNSFLEQNNSVFQLAPLEKNKKIILWTALFQKLQNRSAIDIHALCLSCLRVLSRDKSDLDSILCENWINVLLEHSGLMMLGNVDEEEMQPVDFPPKEVMLEAIKCLCNLAFNSEVARALCAHSCLAQALVGRLKMHKELPFKEEILAFDMKLLFILTALRPDIKSKVNELHGLEYLTNCLAEVLAEAREEGATAFVDRACLNDNQQVIACEILKCQFNLMLRPEAEEGPEPDDVLYLRLVPLLCSLLLVHTTSDDKKIELTSNIANLFTSIPVKYYGDMSPALNPNEACEHALDNRNMDAVHALLDFLHVQLTHTQSTKWQLEKLSPILSVLVRGARSSRPQRRYLRARVLPPLAAADVSAPPEHGDTLRNRLCRLLTTPVTQVRDLAADFLFVLCKEKVGRMVKYTGFGNAAGLLAQRGLLAGGSGGGSGGSGDYSSSSEDSDTEEYRAAASRIDPVVGCTRPPRPDPLAGMSQEQKEVEALKLVGLLDALSASGVVRPARVGPDGRPQPLQHVLELRDPPHRHAS